MSGRPPRPPKQINKPSQNSCWGLNGKKYEKNPIIGVKFSLLFHDIIDICNAITRFPWVKIEKRPWSDLPEEILEMIASHLQLVEGIRFSAVCKRWRSITPATRPFNPPFLLLYWKNQNKIRLLDPSSNKSYSGSMWPELFLHKILFSNHGWLLCSMSTGNLVFLNPFTKEVKGGLPSLPDHCYKVTFSHPPTSSVCTVVAIKSQDGFMIYTCNLGDETWKVHFYDEGVLPIKVSDLSVYDGIFYFLGHWGEVGVTDPKNKTWVTLYKPRGFQSIMDLEFRGGFEKNLDYMTEFEGDVYIVSIGLSFKSIRIFRLDPYKLVMEEIRSLGDRTICIYNGNATIATVKVRGMENKIYFPVTLSYGGSDQLFYYSMETLMYYPYAESFLPEEESRKRELNLLSESMKTRMCCPAAKSVLPEERGSPTGCIWILPNCQHSQ